MKKSDHSLSLNCRTLIISSFIGLLCLTVSCRPESTTETPPNFVTSDTVEADSTKAEEKITNPFISNFYKENEISKIYIAISDGCETGSRTYLTPSGARQDYQKYKKTGESWTDFNIESRKLTEDEHIRLIKIVNDFFIAKTKKLILSSVKNDIVVEPGPFDVTIEISFPMNKINSSEDFRHIEKIAFPYEGHETQSYHILTRYAEEIKELYDIALGDADFTPRE